MTLDEEFAKHLAAVPDAEEEVDDFDAVRTGRFEFYLLNRDAALEEKLDERGLFIIRRSDQGSVIYSIDVVEPSLEGPQLRTLAEEHGAFYFCWHVVTGWNLGR